MRDALLARNIVTYTEVLISPASQPGDDFDIQPARMQPISSKICLSVVDWKFGEILSDLTFEQMQGCKRVIAYHRSKTKGVLNATTRISTR